MNQLYEIVRRQLYQCCIDENNLPRTQVPNEDLSVCGMDK